MINGLLKYYKHQKTVSEHFNRICNLLFRRFLVRVYRSSTLEIQSKSPFGNFTIKCYKSIIELIKLYVTKSRVIQIIEVGAKLFSCGNSKANSELQQLLEENYRILESCCYTQSDIIEELLTRIKNTITSPHSCDVVTCLLGLFQQSV